MKFFVQPITPGSNYEPADISQKQAEFIQYHYRFTAKTSSDDPNITASFRQKPTVMGQQ